jgi:glycerophosphoryl diester phosphodiesterase
MLSLNEDFPQKNRDMKIGLYIETKMYNFYKNERGVDIAELLYNNLKKYDLETIAKAEAKLPIIFECFERESLVKFSTLSDLPRVYLMFWNNPVVNDYNLEEISTFAHGVGPRMDFLFNYKNETFNLD